MGGERGSSTSDVIYHRWPGPPRYYADEFSFTPFSFLVPLLVARKRAIMDAILLSTAPADFKPS